MVRGGSWNNNPDNLRSSNRNRNEPDNRNNNIGFRVARVYDLFEPYRRRQGLPIGNLTSQFFANLYLDRFDHWVSEHLGGPYVRYVDDFALFNDDPAVLVDWRVRIERYLEGRRLKLHPRKTVILATSEPSTFLGFALHAGSRKHSGDKAGRGQRRLPEDNVARFRNRLRGLRDRWRAGTASKADVEARIGAWIAHADHADTFWLKQTLFEAGWFEQVPGMR